MIADDLNSLVCFQSVLVVGGCNSHGAVPGVLDDFILLGESNQQIRASAQRSRVG